MGVPMGTVMSTLSRARARFRDAAGDLLKTHGSSQMEGLAATSLRFRQLKRSPGIS
jgi:hypothetical protein